MTKDVETQEERKNKGNRKIIIYVIIAAALIAAPWAWVIVLLTESDVAVVSTDLVCNNVQISLPCDDCLAEAKMIMDECGVLDTHNDLPWTFVKYQDVENPTISVNTPIGVDLDSPHVDLNGDEILNGKDKHTNLRLMREGRLVGQFWSIYVSCSTNFKDAVDWALEQIDITQRMVDKYDEFEIARNPYEAREIIKSGKIASMMGVEGGHMIGSRLSILRQLFNLGIRYMTLTHNCNTPWADQNQADGDLTLIRNNGLSDFGRAVVTEMNRLGMLVDLSHVSAATMRDSLDVSSVPVIFSHSNARDLTDNVRNVPDDVLDLLKINGGTICITFVPGFLRSDSSRNSTIMDIADHFDHVKNRIGAEHLCIGGDYNGISSLPDGAEDVGKYPNIIAELLKRNWTQTEIQGILQENIFRVWAKVYDYAEIQRTNKVRGDPQFMLEEEYEADELSCKELVPWK